MNGKRKESHCEDSGEQHLASEGMLPAAFHAQAAGLLAEIACAALGD